MKLQPFPADWKEVDPSNVIHKGIKAEELRNNPSFEQAINDLYAELTLEEDRVVYEPGLDDRKRNDLRKHYSAMRASLTNLVYTLDGYVREAKGIPTQNN